MTSRGPFNLRKDVVMADLAAIKEYVNNNFPIDIKTEYFANPTSAANSVKYIYKMAPMIGIDITRRKLGEFGHFSDNKFVMLADLREINRVLVDEKKASQEPDNEFDESMLHAIRSLENSFLGYNPEENKIFQNILSNQARAEALYGEYMSCLRREKIEWNKLNKSLHALPDLKAQIKQIKSQGFWDFDTDIIGTLMCWNKSPIVISYRNNEQGIDTDLDFGKLTFDISDFHNIKPLSGEKPINAGHRYYHPHVRDKQICWGDLRFPYQDCASRGDLIGCLNVLKELVTTYNDDDPFRSIGYWVEKYDSNYDGDKWCPDCDQIPCHCNDEPEYEDCEDVEF